VADVPEVYGYPRLIVELAEQYRLPTLYPAREFVELGGLFAYGVDYDDLFRRAGGIVGRVLNGNRPEDIPFYQATTFELVLNLRTAKTLGIEMPPLLLARADEVIE
jgi:putative ABC transport system substrate-binding protein